MAEPALGEVEDIEIILLPPAEVKRKIAEGEITSGQVILAFYWYRMVGDRWLLYDCLRKECIPSASRPGPRACPVSRLVL